MYILLKSYAEYVTKMHRINNTVVINEAEEILWPYKIFQTFDKKRKLESKHRHFS